MRLAVALALPFQRSCFVVGVVCSANTEHCCQSMHVLGPICARVTDNVTAGFL